MNDLISHAGHLFSFDGMFHWCFLIAISIFLIGFLWVVVRVLIPLKRLSSQAARVMQGDFSAFDEPINSFKEIEQLRKSLHYMIGEIKSAQERETMYRNALTESQENERKRIAREIHDDTIQSLVLVAHHIERATQAVKTNENQSSGHLENARTQLIAAIDNLRQLIANLRPTILDELGLAAAIEVLCEKYHLLEFSVVGNAYGMNQTHELAIFRAAQEAIYNAQRHAQAKRIVTTLTYSETAVTLEVRDDGIGFRIPDQLQEFSTQGHYGLIGIRERILHLGGKLNLVSQSDVGTRVIVNVPTTQPTLIAA